MTHAGTIASSYDYRLVVTSLVIAMAASYVALDLAGRTAAAHGRARAIWLGGGATAMGIAARCRQLQIAAYLVKPVGQKQLRDSVTAILAGQQRHGVPAPFITRHTLRESRAGFDILLAEDNLINQRLAVKLLEKHGYRVRVAANGREALASLEKGKFQVVLMDVQMPLMGGFEATAAIREKEKTTGAHIPIIAMTAHAMIGDREKCLQAGMDGYVSKPIKIKELLDAIDAAVTVPR